MLITLPLLSCGQQGEGEDIQVEQAAMQQAEAGKTEITVYKRPNCRCCTAWADYLEENGFSVTQTPSDTLQALKDHYQVPEELESCHTALVDGYVVEGHVPVESINKMLNEQPDALGLAVPNMPTGTPGMGNDGTPYDVHIFNAAGKDSVYAEY